MVQWEYNQPMCAMFKRRICQTIDRYDKKQLTLPLALLKAQWPAWLASRMCGTLCLIFKNASL